MLSGGLAFDEFCNVRIIMRCHFGIVMTCKHHGNEGSSAFMHHVNESKMSGVSQLKIIDIFRMLKRRVIAVIDDMVPISLAYNLLKEVSETCPHIDIRIPATFILTSGFTQIFIMRK